MEKRKIVWIAVFAAVILAAGGCLLIHSSQNGTKAYLVDGYYTAEMADYSHGWKEFVTIAVNSGKIVSVEYNAKTASGFIKSWDMAYMESMNKIQGTYPNRYTRSYAASFLEKQSAQDIDTITGATESGKNFEKMAEALMEKAKKGDFSIAIVQAGE